MSKVRFNVVLASVVLLLILASCGEAAAGDVVEVTRVVLEESQVEVTRLVEVEVEVTRVVEVEVTRVVEVEVIATAVPPTNTPTPEAPEVGTAGSPVPLGTAQLVENADGQSISVTVSEVIRGDDALDRIMAANQFNDPPTEGFEYVLLHVDVSTPADNEGAITLDHSSLQVVTNNRVIRWFDAGSGACCLVPEFDFQMLPGGTGDGWVALLVAVDDPAPMMLLGDADRGVYFSLTQ